MSLKLGVARMPRGRSRTPNERIAEYERRIQYHTNVIARLEIEREELDAKIERHKRGAEDLEH